MERRTVEILGCRIDPVSGAEAVERVFRWCDAPERRSHIIVTVNVAILMTMRDDPALAHAIRQADLVVVDGKPLVWTARWFRFPSTRAGARCGFDAAAAGDRGVPGPKDLSAGYH